MKRYIPKFKIGDVVKRINHRQFSINETDNWCVEINDVGIVIGTDKYCSNVLVRFFNGTTCNNIDTNLELVKELDDK